MRASGGGNATTTTGGVAGTASGPGSELRPGLIGRNGVSAATRGVAAVLGHLAQVALGLKQRRRAVLPVVTAVAAQMAVLALPARLGAPSTAATAARALRAPAQEQAVLSAHRPQRGRLVAVEAAVLPLWRIARVRPAVLKPYGYKPDSGCCWPSGGGGGGGGVATGGNGGHGGTYGGAGGGAASTSTSPGTGGQGIIVLTYTPTSSGFHSRYYYDMTRAA